MVTRCGEDRRALLGRSAFGEDGTWGIDRRLLGGIHLDHR